MRTPIATKALPVTYATENQSFAKDMVDLLTQRRSGHMSKWLYSKAAFVGDPADGSSAWAKVVAQARTGSPYYVFREEEAIIQQSLAALKGYIRPQTRLIDIGPGSKDAFDKKVAPILRCADGLITEYLAVDIDEQALDSARKAASAFLPPKAVRMLKADFINDRFDYGDIVPHEMAVFFGLTAFNMPIDPRVRDLPELTLGVFLQRLQNHQAGVQSCLVMTQDHTQDPTVLRDAYFAIADYFWPLLHRIARDLSIDGDYNPAGFDLDVDFFPDTYACSICFIPRKNMAFRVNGTPVRLEKGARLYFHNAYKGPAEWFLNAAKAAGYTRVITQTRQSKAFSLHILSV